MLAKNLPMAANDAGDVRGCVWLRGAVDVGVRFRWPRRISGGAARFRVGRWLRALVFAFGGVEEQSLRTEPTPPGG